MKKVLYLIQAKSDMPPVYYCLKKEDYVLLSYFKPASRQANHIYAPDTTWSQGRNILYNHIVENQLRYDYYIFLDEDVFFTNVNQERGFQGFVSDLEILDYPVIVPSLHRYNEHFITVPGVPESITVQGLENLDWPLQTVDWFDQCFLCLSAAALFEGKLLPYEDKFDADSWWISGFIMILQANRYYHNRIIQNNRYMTGNASSAANYTRSLECFHKVYIDILNELRLDHINMSSGHAVNIKLPSPHPGKNKIINRIKYTIKKKIYKFWIKLYFKEV